MLEVIVFLSGAILMSLEILGSRVLAPAFGNSIFVWGSLIGVFLGALSAGYYVGGMVADARPRAGVLGGVIAAAGLLVLVVPTLSAPVASLADLGPRAGPLLAATALFFAPTALLGMVSPFAIRLRGTATERLGRTAGQLYALSTVGSIAGTLVTAFFLVPAVGVGDLVRYLGAALLALGGVAALRGRSWRMVLALAAAAVVAVVVARVQPAELELGPNGQLYRVLYRQDSLYHHIRVLEGGGYRFLRFDNSWQSGMDLSDPSRSPFPYVDYFHAALLLRPEIRDVLFVGLGGGQAPKRFLKDYPWMNLEVAELDPDVVSVARRYFNVPDDPRLRITVADGRQYLEKTTRRYDLIVMDAYYADAIPFHLTTREFFQLARSRLKEGGLVAANVIGALAGPKSALYTSFYATMADAFPERYVFPVKWVEDGGPESLRNIIVFAGNGPARSPAELAAGRTAAQQRGVQADVLRLLEQRYTAMPSLKGATLLTDDRAPVENLLRLQR